jgi:hypothetical protein
MAKPWNVIKFVFCICLFGQYKTIACTSHWYVLGIKDLCTWNQKP